MGSFTNSYNQINSSTMYQTGTPDRTQNMKTFSQSPEVRRISPNLSLRLSPERRFSPKRGNSPRNSPIQNSYTTNINTIKVSDNNDYEKNQFLLKSI